MTQGSGNEPDIQGKKTPDEVRERIEELDDEQRYKPSEIQQKVAREFPGEAPKLRTVQDIIKKWREKRGLQPWSLQDPNPVDARPVLDVLAEEIWQSGGLSPRITRKEAELILKVHAAAPWLKPSMKWAIAREYLRREESPRGKEDLDAYLAFCPAPTASTDEEMVACRRYARVMRLIWHKRGVRPRIPLFLMMVPREHEAAKRILAEEWYPI